MYKQPGRPTFYLVTGYVDFRCGIDSLCYKLRQLNKDIDLTSNSAYIVMGKHRDRIKILYWGGDGFWLIQHRLEKSKYVWLNSQESMEQLSYQQLVWLLDGLPYKAKKIENYTKKDYVF